MAVRRMCIGTRETHAAPSCSIPAPRLDIQFGYCLAAGTMRIRGPRRPCVRICSVREVRPLLRLRRRRLKHEPLALLQLNPCHGMSLLGTHGDPVATSGSRMSPMNEAFTVTQSSHRRRGACGANRVRRRFAPVAVRVIREDGIRCAPAN